MPDDIRQYFEAEARELIDRLAVGTGRLLASQNRLLASQGALAQGADDDAATLADMRRAAHTLKGAAHVVGERGMAAQAHAFEDELALFREQPSAERKAALLALVDGLARDLESKPSPTGHEQPPPKPEQSPAQAAKQVRASLAAPSEAPPRRAQSAFATPESQPPAMPSRSVRVEIAQTARLLEQVDAAGVPLGALRDHLTRLEALAEPKDAHRLERAELRRSLSDDLDRLQRSLDEVHRTASQFRVASTEALLLAAGRTVRSTAAALGKRAACVTRGGAERIEVRLLDALADAMLHLIRNAIAHGVEPPDERQAAGKPVEATITITVERRGRSFQFTCADDGRGIALEAIRAAAIGRGDLTLEAAAEASSQELLALLLRPGFSLSAGADQVSGRGVGLDAVREAVHGLGGQVSIDSVPGRGTTFTLTVPQTLFATAVLQVLAAGQRYAIPLAAVEQTFRMDAHPIGQSQGTQTLLLGRETMPVFSLNEIVPHQPANPALLADEVRAGHRTCLVLNRQVLNGRVLNGHGSRLAISVDAVDGISDLMVQPLPTWLAVEPWIAGIALTPRGTPILVVDAAELSSSEAGARAPRPASSPALALPILVIDDSLTTRMLEQSILEAEGYVVELATSAEQGLRMARSQDYALMLVDVEMPGMNGFEFIAATRADEQLRDVPAILVTSLDSAESRERGRAAGAYSYIVKGDFNQPVYLDRISKAIRSRGIAAPGASGREAPPQPGGGAR